MTTAFDNVPYAFTPETVDMVNARYAVIQREERINLTDPEYSTAFRADIVYSVLQEIADFPDRDNSEAILTLAAYAVSWVETLGTESFESE